MAEITDITFRICNVRVNCRAVAIIVNNDKILFQKRENDIVWSLPGGKIAVLEKGGETIKRELKEEIGEEVEINKSVGFFENFFTYDNEKFHEYMFMYLASLKDDSKIKENKYFDGIEENKHLKYAWFDENDLDTISIAPIEIKEMLIKFIDNSKNNMVKSKVRR